MHRRVRHLNPAQCGAQIALDARFITGVADGAALSSWTSRPVASISASQATPANQPVFRASQINGRPSVQFDGSNDFMSLSAGAASLTNNISSIWLLSLGYQLASGDSDQAAIFLSTASAGVTRVIHRIRNASASAFYSQARRLDADAASQNVASGNSAVAAMYSSKVNYAANSMTSAVNGVETVNTTFASGGGNTSATNSSATNIGAVSSTVFRLNGYLSAVVAFVPIPSQSIINRVRQHFGFSFRIATH